MRTQLRKIYYVPGLISAIIIPLVFWYLGNTKLNEPIPNVMDFGLPAKDGDVSHETFENYRNWKYQKIIVKPHTAKANSKFYVSELKKLKIRNEKETGIEFILNDSNSYGDFVSILNDFAIAKQDKYGLDLEKTAHLFATVDYKNPKAIEMEYISLCGGSILIEENTEFKGLRNFYNEVLILPKKAYYLIFSFLIFLQISFLSLVRKFIR